MKRILQIFVLFLFVSKISDAQVTTPVKEFGWSAGLLGGTSFFTGDVEINEILAINNTNRELQLIKGVRLSHALSPVMALDIRLVQGKLSGSDWEQDAWSKSKIFEADIRLRVNLVNLYCNQNKSVFNPYLATGLGSIFWSTELYNFRKEDIGPADNKPVSEGNKLTIPLALGMDYRFNERFSAGIEAEFHHAFSDRIDGSGQDGKNDKYGYLTAGVSYHFGNPVKASSVKFAGRKNKPETIANIDQKEALATSPAAPDKKEAINYLAGIDEAMLKTEEEAKGEDIWSDVVFKIQVMASHTRQNIYRFAKKNNITARIDENKQDNLFKYTIGEFSEYRKALEYKAELIGKTKLKDAFVVAYNKDAQVNLHDLMMGKRGNITEFSPSKKNIEGIIFSVQVFSTKNLKMSVAEFKEKYNLREETRIHQIGDSYQIVSGYFTDYKEAKNYRREIIEKGLPDAFIVAFKNGSRISLKNAFEDKKGIVHD